MASFGTFYDAPVILAMQECIPDTYSWQFNAIVKCAYWSAAQYELWKYGKEGDERLAAVVIEHHTIFKGVNLICVFNDGEKIEKYIAYADYLAVQEALHDICVSKPIKEGE